MQIINMQSNTISSRTMRHLVCHNTGYLFIPPGDIASGHIKRCPYEYSTNTKGSRINYAFDPPRKRENCVKTELKMSKNKAPIYHDYSNAKVQNNSGF